MVKRNEVEVIEAPETPWMGWTLVILGILAVVALGGIVVFGGGEAEEPGGGGDECPNDCPVEPVSLDLETPFGAPPPVAHPAGGAARPGATMA